MNKKEYPYNLALDIIWPEEKRMEFKENVPEDIDETIEFLLNRIDSRKKTVLIDYYKEHKTLATIGNSLAVTTSRAGSLKESAIKEIRRHSGVNILLMGKTKLEAKVKEQQKKCSEKEIKLFYELMRAEREFLEDVSLPAEVKDAILGVSVEELSLEKRTVTTLRRNGLNTVVDLLKLNNQSSRYHFKNVRGLGQKGFNELKDVFKKMGIELKW